MFLRLFTRRLLSFITLVILFIVIALHFGLVDLGHWSLDEFALFSSYRHGGWTIFFHRLIEWSPRPISEALLWAYACLVNWKHEPFIGVFLGFLWLTLIWLPLIPILQIRRSLSENPQISLVFLLLFGFTPIAFFILGRSSGELFYWPVGAAAYLMTLSAITLCFFQVVFNRTEESIGRAIASFALIFAAGASETGAFFSVIFCCLFLAGIAIDTFRGSCSQQRILWCVFPALIGVSALGLLVQNRVGRQRAAFSTAEYHSLFLSLKAALGQTLKECLVTGKRLSSRSLLLGLSVKVSYFLGIRYCWLASGVKTPRRQALIVFSLSLAATILFSLAASYYGYGASTNDRHHELRQCLMILLITTGSLLSCHYHAAMIDVRRSEWLGAIFVFIALFAVVPGRLTALMHDYKNYSVSIERRRQSWNSGLSDGDTMAWYLAPQGQVASNYVIAPGTYSLHSKSPAGVQEMMQFFEKGHVEIRSFVGPRK